MSRSISVFHVPLFSACLLLMTFVIASNAQALKPSHEADRLIMAAQDAIVGNDYVQAERYLEEAKALGIDLPPGYDFLYGRVLYQQNELLRARTQLEQYVDATGNEGEYYREALMLITEIEKLRSGRSENADSSSQERAEIRWAGSDAQSDYLTEIQALYQLDSPQQALVEHINSLLQLYAYGGDRIIGGSRVATPTRHRIVTTDRGEIVSFNRSGADEQTPITEDHFPVYGVNPYLRYECSSASANCWLIHPVTAGRWLQILNDREAVDELTKAFSHLIREMQATD